MNVSSAPYIYLAKAARANPALSIAITQSSLRGHQHRARQPHKQYKGYHKERGHRSGPGGFSEYFGGFHPLPEWRCALRFKASSSSPKRRCAMIFQKSQPPETEHGVFPLPRRAHLKIWMHHPPHQKRTHTKHTKNLEAFRALVNCHGPYGKM